MSHRPFPWPAIILALATGLGMLMARIDLLLVLAIMLLWIGSLWITRPESPVVAPQTDAVQLTRDGMRDMIEHFSLPLLMMDGKRIFIANAAAREVFGSHIVGQDARVCLRHPQAIALLDQEEDGTATISGLTTARSIWQITRQAINDRYWLIELHNRTAEADISRAHTDFVANASHELRTPLASIIGYIETLADAGDTVEPALAAKFHETVLRESRRLQSLVSDLLSLSRVEAEKHDSPVERIDIARLASSAARDAGLPEEKERVEVRVHDSPVMIRGDRAQLEQLVRNLVDNALKYGSPGEPVIVSLALEANDRALLTVADRGEGIDAEHIPHLTRRFYRTDPGRSRAAGGTGLGLAIVKHIVERHRGRLDITSKRGQGTTVSVRLPLVVA